MHRLLSFVTAAALSAGQAVAGPYSTYSNDPANPHDAPIHKNSEEIRAWANAVSDYSPAPGVGVMYQDPVAGFGSLGDLYDPLNPPETGTKPPFHGVDELFNGIVGDLTDSYGFIGIDDPGSITVSFPAPIYDGPGHDFATFENGIIIGGYLSAELAYVEVSTDGVNFARFDGISSNDAPSGGWPGYESFDVTNIYNLAGKHANGWGTPFDLADLQNHSLVQSGDVDLQDIRHVRLVDIPGSGYFVDSQGHDVLDPWITYNSGGYDFRLSEGVAGLNVVPLRWDGAPDETGAWATPNWHDGNSGGHQPPSRARMVVDVEGSIVTVDRDFISGVGEDGPAGSVQVDNATLVVDSGIELEVTNTVTVGTGGLLQVDGILTADNVIVHGTLSGSGAIVVVGSVEIRGVLSPGGSGPGVLLVGESIELTEALTEVPEPSALLLLAAGATTVCWFARRRTPGRPACCGSRFGRGIIRGRSSTCR